MKIKLQPADGRQVRKEDARLLNKKGDMVVLNSYWQRRIGAGDVVIVEDNKKAKS
jgi:hypothetical protein